MLREHPWPALLVAAAESNTTHDTRQSNEADHPRRPAGAVPGALGLRGREAGGWRRMSAVLGAVTRRLSGRGEMRRWPRHILFC